AALLDAPPPAAAARTASLPRVAGRPSAARRLRVGARVSRRHAAAPRDVGPDARRAGGAGARDLVRGEGGRRRPLASALLRDGAAALPRDARAVHRERPRRARVVL